MRTQLIKFLDDCLLIDNSILVIGDMHVGYEEHIFEQGLLPRIQMRNILSKLERIFKELYKDKVELNKIILLGDLKHEFGGISDSEWRDSLKLLDYLENKIKDKKEKEKRSRVSKTIKKKKIVSDINKIILIKGNHDNILGPIARKKGIRVKNFYKIKIKEKNDRNEKRRWRRRNVEICFLHGHKLFKNCLDSQILIMGHLHPCISLKDKYKKEKFKCFLVGKWKRKLVYILPSFSGISFGYDVSGLGQNKREGFVIVGERALRNFEVLIYNNKEKKVHNFGRLG